MATLDGFDSWKTRSPEQESVTTLEQEAERERRWYDFECDCRDFANSEPDGFAAVLRAVASAMKAQGVLWRG